MSCACVETEGAWKGQEESRDMDPSSHRDIVPRSLLPCLSLRVGWVSGDTGRSRGRYSVQESVEAASLCSCLRQTGLFQNVSEEFRESCAEGFPDRLSQ